MAAPYSVALRRTIHNSAGILLRSQSQRRYARVHDVRFVTTHRDSSRILDRYKDKLDQKAKQYVTLPTRPSILKFSYEVFADDVKQ